MFGWLFFNEQYMGLFLGLALFARAPVDGSFVVDVLPGMTVFGIGLAIMVAPLTTAPPS